MKQPDYRHIILFIIFGVTFSIGITRFILRPSHENAAIIVNKKTVSIDEFNEKFNNKSYFQDKNGFISSMVLRELLVQEALKAGIQTQDYFIKSIKEYYEQSLAQSMVDQKYKNLDVKVDEFMIDRYLDLSNKTLDITVLNYISLDNIKHGKPDSEEKMSLAFDRLSSEVKYELLTLKEGGHSEPSCSSSEGCSVFRLDRIRSLNPEKTKETDRQAISQIIKEQKKERLVSEWLDTLKNKAAITIGNTVSDNNSASEKP